MNSKNLGINTICTHTGEVKDTQFGGAVSPIFTTTSYPFLDVDSNLYPRAFNSPNQTAVAKKIAALEGAEAGLVFGSGMAAISTSLLAFLKKGDHIVFQNQIYGGTFNLIKSDFDDMGIAYSFTEGLEPAHFEEKIQKNTKVIYLETPSNPLLAITDIAGVAQIAQKHSITSFIDNTFASPINQNPIDLGVDVIIHSATKYLGGHSDISAGATVAAQEHIDRIYRKALNFGGHLADQTCYLLERSIKTLGLRIKQHNENAQQMAEFLAEHHVVNKVYYPGLPNHPGHDIAKTQMHGFGGMLSFELNNDYDTVRFLKRLGLIKPSMSLAGVESTMLLPYLTSHALLSETERKKMGVTDQLIRFSVGIENVADLINDIEQALRG